MEVAGGYDNVSGTAGSSIGGAGGNGAASRTTASGGTGNPGGNLRSNNGTGGLLIIYSNTFNNNGTISANGVNRRNRMAIWRSLWRRNYKYFL